MNFRASSLDPLAMSDGVALGNDQAVDHEERLVRDAKRARHVVGDHDVRDMETSPSVLDEVVDHAARERIEPTGRLIVDQDLGSSMRARASPTRFR